MNLATVIVLLMVAALVIVAIHFIQKGKSNGSCCSKPNSGCWGCSLDCPFKH